jgi:hypothetical protein
MNNILTYIGELLFLLLIFGSIFVALHLVGP